MTDAEVERSLAAVVDALEAQFRLVADVIDTTTNLMHRDLELQEGIADLSRTLDHHVARARLLYSMKAATLVTSCARCGTRFASEPGPELCGPCWTELGRPDRYLAPVPPEGA